MNNSSVTLAELTIPPEVQEFATEKGIGRYLIAAMDLARLAFPSAALCGSLEQDAEDERHQYIALDVEVHCLTTEELLAGQQIWSEGISRVCPSYLAVYFVLGWR
jgi:hypothetical protein